MKPRIAISAPMSVPMEHLSEVEDLLNVKYEIPYGHISFWDRKSAYDQNQFNRADAVVVILNDFAFDSSKVINFVVPIGVHRELQEANKQQKKVFLAYRRKTDGVLNLYTASFILGKGDDYKRTAIMGIPTNSSDTFKDWLKTFVSKESEVDDAMKSLGIDAQAELEKAAIKLMTNSIYGSVVSCNTDPVDEQVKLPMARRVYASLIPNPDYSDERLLLML
jgi:hypothetical protein